MKVSIIIPTKNEESTIAEVIKEAKKYAWEILVVDGYSTDRTREIAKEAGARVILDEGGGKGKAIRKAVREARGEVLLFMDADGSHEPRDIPFLLKPIEEGKAEQVTASRILGGSDELSGSLEKSLRLLGTLLINFLISLRFGVRAHY
ncbi:MAG: glycosyltransferase family 2 protein [Caldiserica bacterium]|nr:glycosyltransferase family 2 protein [Caldisericota bacterium]